jgi:hypothetical protein
LLTHKWSVRTHDHGTERVTSQGNKMEITEKYFVKSKLDTNVKQEAYYFTKSSDEYDCNHQSEIRGSIDFLKIILECGSDEQFEAMKHIEKCILGIRFNGCNEDDEELSNSLKIVTLGLFDVENFKITPDYHIHFNAEGQIFEGDNNFELTGLEFVLVYLQNFKKFKKQRIVTIEGINRLYYENPIFAFLDDEQIDILRTYGFKVEVYHKIPESSLAKHTIDDKEYTFRY